MDVQTAHLAHVCIQQAALNWIHGPEAPIVGCSHRPTHSQCWRQWSGCAAAKEKKRWPSLSLEHTKNTYFFLVLGYQEYFRFSSGTVNQAAMTNWLASCGQLVTNVCLPPWLDANSRGKRLAIRRVLGGNYVCSGRLDVGTSGVHLPNWTCTGHILLVRRRTTPTSQLFW